MASQFVDIPSMLLLKNISMTVPPHNKFDRFTFDYNGVICLENMQVNGHHLKQ